MRKSTEATKRSETPLSKDIINLALYYLWRASNLVRSHLGGRRGFIILTMAVLAVGLAFSWSWLVAIGIAPLLVALAPCAVMCALGLCTVRTRGGGSCASEEKTIPTPVSPSRRETARALAGVQAPVIRAFRGPERSPKALRGRRANKHQETGATCHEYRNRR